jgi:hypothetical protein
MEIETEAHDFCLEIINGLVEQLKESLYHLTNPKLNFWMDLLRGQIEKKK